MNGNNLLAGSIALIDAMDKAVDNNLPQEIADVVKFHSKGAAASALASAWIPGAGGITAITISAGFIWSMYARINKKIDLSFSENILKTVASGVATNLAAAAASSLVISTALSIFPGIGSLGASVIMGGTSYALTLASGFVYIKILTRIFKAKKDPSTMTADELKKVAKDIVDNEDIKSFMNEAGKEFKAERKRGNIK